MKKEQNYIAIIKILLLIILVQGIFIFLKFPKKVVKVPPPLEVKGEIAIVVDDWGYNLNNLSIMDEIQYPLTISVLPNLDYSKEIAQALHQRGFEIILHLPMEPYEKYRLEKNTIMTSFSERATENIIAQDLANIAYAKGVSNHMGSRATEDKRTMQILFKELKQRGLYFLDSVVSPNSICMHLAKEMNLGFARRDVFLDNSQDPAYIEAQMQKLQMKAKLYGRAIGIAHDRKNTLETLKEVMPQLEKEGFKFVFVSELVEK